MSPGRGVRVIAGEAGGRRLRVDPRTRPTTDRVKEAVFSMVGPVDGLAVLDGCAGSGALAIEALSRGAAGAVLVEPDRAARRVTAANLEATGYEDRARIVPAELDAALTAPAPSAADLVLLDPPYDWSDDRLDAVLGALAESGWVAPGAVVVVERPRGHPPGQLPPGWRSRRERTYGDTLVVVIDT